MASSSHFVYDPHKQQLQLGQELGRGGEGAVYEVVGHSDLVAKIYHLPQTPERFAKIEAMASIGEEQLLRIAAWPREILLDRPGGSSIGFTMARVSGFEEIHELYSPRVRLQKFPEARWKFLINTALNAARAFNVLHGNAIVLGDVNEKNFRVSDRSLIRLIDCDSFQITVAGRTYPCEVGVPTFTPPELQGTSLRGVKRTPNHDAFGLAVLVFHLLFMGRHPFAGRPLDQADVPIPKAISEFRFAYGARAASRKMQPPPGSLPLAAVGASMAALFEQAFSADGAREHGRPLPRAWMTELENLMNATVQCNRNAAHSFYRELQRCPWCEIESQIGFIFFNMIITPPLSAISDAEVSVIWKNINAIKSPGTLPQLPSKDSFAVMPSYEAQLRSQRLRRENRIAAVLIGVMSIPMAIYGFSETAIIVIIMIMLATSILVTTGRFNARSRDYRTAKQTLREAEHARVQLLNQWQNEASSKAFDNALITLKQTKRKYDYLPERLSRLMRELAARHRELQMKQYLENTRIDRSLIVGIGPTRTSTLRSYGIETALDVNPVSVSSVPGFGSALTLILLTWRNSVESRFRFDPNKQLPKSEMNRIENTIANERTQLVNDLKNGQTQLLRIKQNTVAVRESLAPKLSDAIKSVAQAECDLAAY